MRTHRLVVVGLLISSAACRTKEAAREAARADEEAARPATLTSAQAPPPAALRARMRGHDRHGTSMRDAVARADLDGAKRAARPLAQLRLDGAIEPAWRKNLDAMNAAAARVVEAKDLTEASRGLAAVARTCGDCHAVLGGPVAVVEEPPADAPGVEARMQRHQWAAARLWDGLVVPDDHAWRAGARVLSDAPLEPELLTPGKSPVPQVGVLARSVRELSHRAAKVDSAVDRGAIYAQVIASCSTCHAWLGGGPPGRKP